MVAVLILLLLISALSEIRKEPAHGSKKRVDLLPGKKKKTKMKLKMVAPVEGR
jgi:hypothetical protein